MYEQEHMFAQSTESSHHDDSFAVSEEPKPRTPRKVKPKDKPKEKDSFPLTRVKNIIKQDDEVQLIATDAVFVVSVATELFLEILYSFIQLILVRGRESYAYTKQENRKTVAYKDVAKAVNSIIAFEFLEDTVPMTLPMRLAAPLVEKPKDNTLVILFLFIPR
jgi:DNA polymerase epsilon subunit 4